MRKKYKPILSIFAMFLFLSPCGSKSAIIPEEEERLLRGEVLIGYHEVEGTLVNSVSARVYYDAPPELVWSVLTDYGAWARIFPDISEAEVLDRKGNAIRLRLRVNNIWPYPDYQYTIAVNENREMASMTWVMEEGNFRLLAGSAIIVEFPEGQDTTLLNYSMVRDPGWLVPFYSATLSNRAVVVERVLALRKEIRERKRAMEGGVPDPTLQPKWRKALFWWEKDQQEQGCPPETTDGNTAKKTD